MGSTWSSGTQSNMTSGYNDPSASDVFAVRRLLLHQLPLELVDIILDGAMYWPKITGSRTTSVEVSAHHGNGNDATYNYLVTPPIPFGEANTPTNIKMVRFRLRSCDQGWGGDPGCTGGAHIINIIPSLRNDFQGPYEGSWTWFEAAIYRPMDGETYQSSSAIHLPHTEEITEADMFAARLIQVEKKVWQIQRNQRASSTVRDHEVIWMGEGMQVDYDDHGDGRGRGEGFLRSLLAGDRISVLARARVTPFICHRIHEADITSKYPGWRNKVHSVEVDIFYAV